MIFWIEIDGKTPPLLEHITSICPLEVPLIIALTHPLVLFSKPGRILIYFPLPFPTFPTLLFPTFTFLSTSSYPNQISSFSDFSLYISLWTLKKPEDPLEFSVYIYVIHWSHSLTHSLTYTHFLCLFLASLTCHTLWHVRRQLVLFNLSHVTPHLPKISSIIVKSKTYPIYFKHPTHTFVCFPKVIIIASSLYSPPLFQACHGLHLLLKKHVAHEKVSSDTDIV